MEHIVKVLEIAPVTHDVRRIVVEKPVGYDFISGQATDVAINLPDWRTELRPFTFTCLNDRNYLEFMIKIYPAHHGVTERLGNIQPGAELVLHDVFGAIRYEGKGTFFAGGAGITPFISIFRDLHRKNQLGDNRLFYSNKTSKDVVMEDELQEMLQKDFVRVFTREEVGGRPTQRIDRNFIVKNINSFNQKFYVCGPDEFVSNINGHLLSMGAAAETVVFEK